jgi:hypothetical protein
MLIIILLCLAVALVCAVLRYFNQPNPPGRDLGWLAFAFYVLAVMIECAVKFQGGKL